MFLRGDLPQGFGELLAGRLASFGGHLLVGGLVDRRVLGGGGFALRLDALADFGRHATLFHSIDCRAAVCGRLPVDDALGGEAAMVDAGMVPMFCQGGIAAISPLTAHLVSHVLDLRSLAVDRI